MESIGHARRLFAVVVFLALLALVVGCGTSAEKASETTEGSSLQIKVSPEVEESEMYKEMSKEMFDRRNQTFDTVQEANSAAPPELRGKVREPKDTLGGSPEEIYIPKQRGELIPKVIIDYSNDMRVRSEYQERKQDYKALAEYLVGLDEQGYGKHSSQAYPVKVAGYDGIALEPGFQEIWGEEEQYPGYLKWQDDDNIEFLVAGDLSVDKLMQVANSMY